MLLEGTSVSKNFGNLAALKNLDFHVNEKEIFGIAGPNGAGKSVLFNVITKIPYRPSNGRIVYEDTDITGLPAYEICKRGIARIFQTPTVFNSLTVFQNVVLGASFGKKDRLDLLTNNGEIERAASEAIEFVGLNTKRKAIAQTLPLIDRKLLMIASSLATDPRILLLDEPFGGLNPAETDVLMRLIKEINERGITIVIIEHIMRALVNLSQRVMILNYGEKIAEGSPETVMRNAKVIEAYLGKTASSHFAGRPGT